MTDSIRLVQSRGLADVARPFAGESSLNYAATRDRFLADGNVPEDLQKQSASLVKFYRHDAKAAGAVGAVLGAATTVAVSFALGVLTLPTLPIVLTAGVVGGALVKWLSFRHHNRGTVDIHHDGTTRTAEFFNNPYTYQKSADEWRLILASQGKLGDAIGLRPPDPPRAHPGPHEVDGYRNTLKDLDRDRRLVADFGSQSTYGHQVLDIIDAPTARALIAAGHPVYVVNGQEPIDTRHQYKADGHTPDGKVKRAEQYDVVERQFKYGLTQVDRAQDVDGVQPAKGLPKSMVGIYKNSDTVSQVVLNNSQDNWARVDGHLTPRDNKVSGSSLDPSVARAETLPLVKVPLTHGDVNAGVAGGVVGTMLAMGLHLAGGVLAVLSPLPVIACAAIGYLCMDKFLRQNTGQAIEG